MFIEFDPENMILNSLIYFKLFLYICLLIFRYLLLILAPGGLLGGSPPGKWSPKIRGESYPDLLISICVFRGLLLVESLDALYWLKLYVKIVHTGSSD